MTPKPQTDAGANRVRIIGGLHRSRWLRFPARPGLRPTPDRVRETLFNWLGQDLTGRHCLDLFAGSGALGLEAASRGASAVVLVDRDRDIAAALRDNARLLGLETARIVQGDALEFLDSSHTPFDVAFVDPPYAGADYGAILGRLAPRLTPDALVYVEAAADLEFPGEWQVVRQLRAGQVHAHLITRAP